MSDLHAATNEEVALAARVQQLERELRAALADAKSWKGTLDMYAHAWRRELGGSTVAKSHEIDALVVTTRILYHRANELDVRDTKRAAQDIMVARPELTPEQCYALAQSQAMRWGAWDHRDYYYGVPK